VVSGEIDIGNGAIMAPKRVLNGTRGRVIPQIEIPDEGAMVRSRYDPVIAGGEWRPLNIHNKPREAVASQAARWIIWRIQVNDGKAIWAVSGDELA